MEIHCSLRLAIQAIVAAFLAGATAGGVVTGCSVDPASAPAPIVVVAPEPVADQAVWRTRIIGGSNSSAGPAR